MHLGDVGLADYFQMILIGGGAKKTGNQFFENVLPDVAAGEALFPPGPTGAFSPGRNPGSLTFF